MSTFEIHEYSPGGIDRTRTILRAAWLAVLLGVAVEVLVVGARFLLHGNTPSAAFLAELSQQTTWAFIVCVGVVIGTTLSRARTLISGLLGLVSGPLGWGLAKAVQRIVQSWLGVSPDQIGLFFYLLCAVKGAEYLILGAVLGHLSERAVHDWKQYAGLGACVGLVTAAVVIALNYGLGMPMTPAKMAGLVVSEFTFPIGCSLVIFAPLRLRHHIGA